MGHKKNKLVNQTDSWFSEGDNVIVGTEPTVLFGNFTGTKNIDVFLAQSSDRPNPIGPAILFKNDGDNTFSKISLAGTNSWSHGATSYDFNSDGISDVMSVSYTDNSFVLLGGLNQQIFSNSNGNSLGIDEYGRQITGVFGSGIAVGDFLNNGKLYAVIGDCGNLPNLQGSFGRVSLVEIYSGKNYAGSPASAGQIMGIIPSTSKLLPLPYLDSEAAKKAGLSESEFIKQSQSNYSHNIRVINIKLNNDNFPDVAVISRPQAQDNNWAAVPADTYITFYENLGDGNFSIRDVFIKKNLISYNAYLRDINGDGLSDFVLSGQFGNTAVLEAEALANGEIKYLESETEKILNFENKIKLEPGASLGPVNIARAPNGGFYVIGVKNRNENDGQRDDIYYSSTGNLFSINISPVTTSVSEGEAASFTVKASGLNPGDTLTYQITGVSDSDVAGKKLSGNVKLNSFGIATVKISTVKDGLLEGNETLTLTIDGYQASMFVRDNDTPSIASVLLADPSLSDLGLYLFNNGSAVIARGGYSVGDEPESYAPLKVSLGKNYVLPKAVVALISYPEGGYGLLSQTGVVFTEQKFSDEGTAQGKAIKLTASQLLLKEIEIYADLDGDGNIGDAIVAVLDEDGDGTQEDLGLFQTLSGALVVAPTDLGKGDAISDGLMLMANKGKAFTLKSTQTVVGLAQKESGNWEILIQAGKVISAQTFDATTGIVKGKPTALKTAQLDAREYYYNLDLTGADDISLVGQETMPVGWAT
jgi:hypothetical protein